MAKNFDCLPVYSSEITRPISCSLFSYCQNSHITYRSNLSVNLYLFFGYISKPCLEISKGF